MSSHEPGGFPIIGLADNAKLGRETLSPAKDLQRGRLSAVCGVTVPLFCALIVLCLIVGRSTSVLS